MLKQTILSPDNRLFTLARRGPHQPSALVAIAVAPILLAFMIASQTLARLLLRPILSVADPIAEIIGFLSIYLGLWVLVRFWSKRPFRSLGFEHRRLLQRILRGAFIA